MKKRQHVKTIPNWWYRLLFNWIKIYREIAGFRTQECNCRELLWLMNIEHQSCATLVPKQWSMKIGEYELICFILSKIKIVKNRFSWVAGVHNYPLLFFISFVFCFEYIAIFCVLTNRTFAPAAVWQMKAHKIYLKRHPIFTQIPHILMLSTAGKKQSKPYPNELESWLQWIAKNIVKGIEFSCRPSIATELFGNITSSRNRTTSSISQTPNLDFKIHSIRFDQRKQN